MPHARPLSILFAMLSVAHAGASLEDQALAAMKKATATFTPSLAAAPHSRATKATDAPATSSRMFGSHERKNEIFNAQPPSTS